MPKLLFDFDKDSFDLDNPEIDAAGIESFNPHRYEFRLIEKVLKVNKETHEAVAYVPIREDQFWVRGHIPGRPIFPGVLQIEAAAQLSSVIGRYCGLINDDKFFGLYGFDKIRYRQQVVPGNDLYILGRMTDVSRVSRFEFQSVVNDKVVNQGEILGTLM